ncbi:argininosuccinate lyase [SAR202 cluster bacterium AD-804-J14_MRT_500m]|nr:argininosuccinate lyase [SAR202 cluster bacterium AD-804-J14_MRT_500m]
MTQPDNSLYAVSVDFDRRLYPYDIAGSIVHARMLAKQHIIAESEASNICAGLESIRSEIKSNTFPWRPEFEDIHMNIEARLTEKIGRVAGKLHTARSRNDQVALDMRMCTKDVTKQTIRLIAELQRSLLDKAALYPDTIMPGYTHLQRAQPVLLAHHLLAYNEMLHRDNIRFRHCMESSDVMPLGSGALAGTPYPLDRNYVAKELGFSKISNNSMDSVSDRDYLVEFHSAASICAMHISRFSEELVLWSSQEFGFITLSAQFTTGSSIMPQKRNPDYAELARGKTGRVFGNLMSTLVMLKGLPLTYNRDLQEDKEAFFDTADTLISTLTIFAPMIKDLQFHPTRMTDAAEKGNMLATDLADYLVSRGLPFREAHAAIREASDYARTQGIEIHKLSVLELKRFSPLFDDTVTRISLQASVDSKDISGGTASARVLQALKTARTRLEDQNDL